MWVIWTVYVELNSTGEHTQDNLLTLPMEIRDPNSVCSFHLKLVPQQQQKNENNEDEPAAAPSYPDPNDSSGKLLPMCPSFSADKETPSERVTSFTGRPLIVEITKEEQELTAFDFTGLRSAVGNLGASDPAQFAKSCATTTRDSNSNKLELQRCKTALIGLLLAKINRCAIYDYIRRQEAKEVNCEAESQRRSAQNWHWNSWLENVKGAVAQTTLYITLRERVTDLLVRAFWRGFLQLLWPLGLIALAAALLFATRVATRDGR